jgi:hypothetical protein
MTHGARALREPCEGSSTNGTGKGEHGPSCPSHRISGVCLDLKEPAPRHP